MATLFDEDGSDGEGQLKINSSYAERYNQWREKEEYQKRKFSLKKISSWWTLLRYYLDYFSEG